MTVVGLFDGLVHLVIVEESKYEYGLTACRRDFVLHEAVDGMLDRDVMPTARSTAPHTCLYCAIAPPSSGAGQEKES